MLCRHSAMRRTLLFTCFFALVPAVPVRGDEPSAASKPDSTQRAAQPAGVSMPLEAQCTDGSVVKVRVTIIGPQASFEGSTRNGVTSSGWGQFPGGFKFKR